jgi:hypothetical protein
MKSTVCAKAVTKVAGGYWVVRISDSPSHTSRDDGSARIGQHETEQAIDITVFGGAGHLRIDFEYGPFNAGAGGGGQPALLRTSER